MQNNNKITICYAIIVGLTLQITGCMVGPKYERPETPADTNTPNYNISGNKQDTNAIPKIDTWSESFAYPVTSELVRDALENNYDLKAAAARVLQAQAGLDQSRGALLPDISYSLDRTRNKFSTNFGTGRFSALTTSYSQGINIAYVVDLWGKLRHAERAAWADMLASEAGRQTLTNSLIASVVRARTDIATLQRRLVIAKENIRNRQQTLEIVERRYNQGLVGPVDVRLARENLAAAQAAEPAIEQSLVIARHALDVLLGRRPGSSEPLPNTLAELPQLEQLPVGIPASLLDRRPDVQAAEFTLRAANERVGVSIAQLFPDLTLTGNIGRSSDTWNDLWVDETEVYSAVIGVAQPIFKGGQLKAQVEAAKARYEELAANYAGTVLVALREVEDALASERLLQIQLNYTQVQLTEALAAENLSQQRYQRGVETILTVLESQRQRQQAQEQVAILMGSIWTTRVNLHLALGGNWIEQEDDEKTTSKL